MKRPHAPHNPPKDGHKICARCRERKPLTEFYVKSKDGRPYSYCKPCKVGHRKFDPDSPTIAERFWANVDKRGPDDCWNWKAGVNSGGYGMLYVGGREREAPAHRVAMKLAGHVLPPGISILVVNHKCKNVLCCNVRHLEIVTQRVNSLVGVDSPHARNSRKTHCERGNHPLDGENLAIAPYIAKNGKRRTTRICLTCYPGRWRFAVVERQPPGRSTQKWVGPATNE